VVATSLTLLSTRPTVTFRNPYKWVTTHLSDPGGTAGCAGFVGWLIADALPTKWSNYSHPSV